MSTAKQFQWLTQLGYTGSIADKQNAYYTDLIANGGDPDIPTSGEFIPDRTLWANNLTAVASGAMQLSYFTARRTETITTVTTMSASTAAGATPTICRVGIYSVASNGDLTLVASTANDTAMWGSTLTAYAKTLSSPFSKVVGTRYACATLVVSGAAIPTFIGFANFTANVAPYMSIAPRLLGTVTGQTDLPASIANASVGDYFKRVGFYLS